MAINNEHIIMVASENGALAGGKVGGVGDVVKNLPGVLVKYGFRVTTIIPSYGFLHKDNPARFLSKVSFPFCGKKMTAELLTAETGETNQGNTIILLEHDQIRGEPIYFNDPPNSPFMRDATKYALFCSAVGQFLKNINYPYILHLHDWHAATILTLRELHKEFSHLKNIKTIFTVHNLAIQGTRPIFGHESSLENWFPEIFRDASWFRNWKDHRYDEPCYTPMAAGIRYADKVNTVSPTYANEILIPSNHQNGYYGSEGLENILQNAKNENRLFGILNGCEYPEEKKYYQKSFPDWCDILINEINLLNKKNSSVDSDNTIKLLLELKNEQPHVILTSISRIVEQKVKLLFEKGSNAKTALDQILDLLEKNNGLYIFLGSGTSDYENLLFDVSEKNRRFILIKGYAENITKILYRHGTIFLMPSLYEPCGISHMSAMREGQPCIVHSVGGLKDTVYDEINGFTFSGTTLKDKVDNLISKFQKVLSILNTDETAWGKIKTEASNARFTWEESALNYINLIYNDQQPQI